MEILDPTALAAFIHDYPAWVAAILFLIVFMEAIIGVGYLVPAATVLFSVGALISAGAVSPIAAVLGASVGATIGGSASYWLGRQGADRIHGMWPFRTRPALLERNQRFVERHGGKSILLSRFTKALRPTVPAVAGMLGMEPLRFAIYNVVGAFAWACIYLGVGVALGATLDFSPAQAIQISALLLTLTLFFGIAVALQRRRRQAVAGEDSST
ncbi:membrane protein DedA with SNARE-associated domain [Natronocella acetinitrilica]|uniref:Membrane protein DedA with SNARE-associated domain n=1 Tax=Natronocella acetinitrilica TaxID=414046 RepID=A0AAE3G2Z8_9GAMM|nr:DedA family protein [Natronocella acetinitrilica]MCP1673751.1 membrane protein DedA with SNARE-associated domain [Natronocella acetinitrilica]